MARTCSPRPAVTERSPASGFSGRAGTRWTRRTPCGETGVGGPQARAGEIGGKVGGRGVNPPADEVSQRNGAAVPFGDKRFGRWRPRKRLGARLRLTETCAACRLWRRSTVDAAGTVPRFVSGSRKEIEVGERVARIRIELQGLEPKIWRRVDVPVRSSLALLHETIRLAMGWRFYERYEFVILGRSYGDPTLEENRYLGRPYKAENQRLEAVIGRGADRFVYVFDKTDEWRHDVIVEEVSDGRPNREYPAFVDGAGRCPPEKVGGPHGFMEFLEAMLNPHHEKHASMRERYGGSFNRENIEKNHVRMALRNIALRRRGAMAQSGARSRRTRAVKGVRRG